MIQGSLIFFIGLLVGYAIRGEKVINNKVIEYIPEQKNKTDIIDDDDENLNAFYQ